MAELPTIAEEAVKKIDSKLECSVCLNSFKEPKLLPCFHVFCKSPCLEELAAQDPEGKALTCPTCRHHVTLPENGVAGLQTDFHIEQLFDIKQSLEKAKKNEYRCQNCTNNSVASKYCKSCRIFLCDECVKIHNLWKKFKSTDHEVIAVTEVKAEELTPAKTTTKCSKHSGMDKIIYCETCSKLICSHCTIRIHKDHNYDVVDDVFHKHKEELVSRLNPLKERLSVVDQALSAFDTKINEVNNKRAAVKEDIKTEINKLRQVLNTRETELTASLDMQAEQKIADLEKQKNDVEVWYAKMSSCLEYAEIGLKAGPGAEGEMLTRKAPVLKRTEEIIAEFDPDTIQPKTEADIELITNDQAHNACENFGTVALCKSVSAENSNATGDGTKFAMENTQVSVEVHPMTTEKNQICEQKFDLTAELVRIKSETSINCDVKQGNGRHTITYQPVSRGRHSLHIRVNGRHIQGSPYPIAVTPSLESLRKPIRIVRCFKKPWGVAINSKGHILIAEHTGHCISVLTLEGEKILSFGSQGSSKGQLNVPRGVTVDLDDNIYVADNNNHRIQKFTSEGVFLAAVGSKGSGNLQFSQPIDICFSQRSHHIYVCDQDNHRVQVLTTDLTFVRCFGTKGSKYGQFQNPKQVAFDSTNNLYVTDYNNDRVQVFKDDGQYYRSFSETENGRKLEKPYAISIDSSDIVYVSELRRQSVSMLTAQGEYIASFGEPGSGDGQFNEIRGICIDHNDSIIVSDSCNNTIQIF